MITRLATPASSDHYIFSHSHFTIGVSNANRFFSPFVLESQRFFLFISGRIDVGKIGREEKGKDESLDTLLAGGLTRYFQN